MARAAELTRRIRAVPRRPSEIRAATLLLASLHERGWHRSVRAGGSYSAVGKPVPWWTYAATDWLDRVLQRGHRVFEFGSGNSTLWLSDRVGEVYSVEHDENWAQKIAAAAPSNVVLSFVPTTATDADSSDEDPYLAPIKAVDDLFDLIVVDGMARNNCVSCAIPTLSSGGLLLLDDADRISYLAAHHMLTKNGFGRIDFFGPKPGVGYLSTTSVFSRDFTSWASNLRPPDPSGY